ncbi:hypothetical protein D3C71_1455360 [compost metagenome]
MPFDISTLALMPPSRPNTAPNNVIHWERSRMTSASSVRTARRKSSRARISSIFVRSVSSSALLSTIVFRMPPGSGCPDRPLASRKALRPRSFWFTSGSISSSRTRWALSLISGRMLANTLGSSALALLKGARKASLPVSRNPRTPEAASASSACNSRISDWIAKVTRT